MNSVLLAENISHSYNQMAALASTTIALEPETFTCLVGPSGCGKSTLLRIFAGLIQPDTGRVLIDGKPLTRPQRHISLVFQDANLMPWRTVKQNLLLPLEMETVPRQEKNERAEFYLKMLGLDEFEKAYPTALSGGMAQRLAIGRALIHDPKVLLMDEPFGALDALTREKISEELLKIWAQTRKTVLMVTHSIQEAVLLADRVLVMSPRPGAILQDYHLDLPRPRDMEMFIQPEFTAWEGKIRRSLRH